MFQDARDYQICFLSLFLLLGFCLKDWTLQLETVGTAAVVCLATQAIASILIAKSSESNLASKDWLPSLRSALITSLSLSLLLRTDHWLTMAFAAMVAIASKFVFRINGKHVFNPANAGIVAAMIFTQDAWVSPGQWGEAGWLALIFIGAGGIVLGRVGRWDTSVVFLAVYSALMLGRDSWLGWSWDVWMHHLSSGSLLLFALFMITDPRSIPDARWSRMGWAIGVASLTFILQTGFAVPEAMFWSLFCLSPLTPLLDRWQSSPRFQWQFPQPM
ncbi:MAG TPA: RnfABCDGE type electron transport complex subunit D [Stenomitos sp.]